MNTRALIVSALAVGTASLMSGCALKTYLFSGPDEAVWGEDATVYGYVASVTPYKPNFETGDCSPSIRSTLPARFEDFCSAPYGSWNLVVARSHVKQGVPFFLLPMVPSTTAVKVDDVVELRYIPKNTEVSFIRVASSPGSPNRGSCDWVGGDKEPTMLSRNATGPRGVVCEGYDFRKLPHFRRSW